MADLILPRELTPGLREVLGMMVFECGPSAPAFRNAGRADIRRKAEEEQAFVLHWLLTLLLEHGEDGWRPVAGETLEAVIAEAKAKARAAEAERARDEGGAAAPA